MEDIESKKFMLGEVEVEVHCSWFHNDGEKWTFSFDIDDDSDSWIPLQIGTTSPTVSTIDNAVILLNREREDEMPLIEGVTNDQKVAMITWVKKVAKELEPSRSAHEAYYGV